MSQESNTESNSGDKPKKRLSLKKKSTSSGFTPEPTPTPAKPKSAETSGTEKPFRMSLKKKDEEEPVETPTPQATPPAPEPEPEPVDETPPPPVMEDEPEPTPSAKIGLKKSILDDPEPPAAPAEEPEPEAFEPTPPPPSVPTPPPVAKKIPMEEAPEPSGEDKPGLLGAASRPPVNLKRDPEAKPRGSSGKGTRPPIPPPGFSIRKDEEEEGSGLLPTTSSILGAPPPILPSHDLMDEEIEADEHAKKGPLKGILVALVILIILVGGIGFFAWGVLGLFSGEEKAPVAEKKPTQAVAEAPAEPAPASPESTEEPTSFIGKTALLTQQVSEKASTDEITESAEKPEKPAPKEIPSEPIKVASAPTAGVTRDVEPTTIAVRSTGDPEVRAWIEGLRPSGVGRGMMLVDGEKFRLGEVVNPQLNIRWVGLDQQLGILIFEDPYGVRYEKDY